MTSTLLETASDLAKKEKEIKSYLDKLDPADLHVSISKWEVEFKLDNSYDPAVYVYPTVKNNKNESREARYSKLSKVRTIVRRKLNNKINSETERRFLYIRFAYLSDDEV